MNNTQTLPADGNTYEVDYYKNLQRDNLSEVDWNKQEN